jgi:hypothetical protein
MNRGARIGFVLVLLALGGLPGAGAGAAAGDVGAIAAAAPSPSDAITVAVTKEGRGYVVEGRCSTQVTKLAAWNVLTDYDAIDGFVSSMRESRVIERADSHLLVEQTAVGRVFLFSRRMTVVLFVHEDPAGVIAFEDVLRRDFTSYRGEWRIEEHGDRREILYRVTAVPAFRVPDLIARGLFGRTVRDLLSQVEAEMVRRSDLTGVAVP